MMMLIVLVTIMMSTNVYGDAANTAVYSGMTVTVIFMFGSNATSEDQLALTNVYFGDTITILSYTLDQGFCLIGRSDPPSTTVIGDAGYTLLYVPEPEKQNRTIQILYAG